MSSSQTFINEARKMDIVDYLEKLGYQPQKVSNNDYWYLSPLRAERTASFKVNRKLNAWYDHGIGRGGNIIDFGILYHQCAIPELLQKLSSSFSFHRETLTVQQPLLKPQSPQEALEPKIKVIAASSLTSPLLCRYLADRKIPFAIAAKFCKEVNFELNGKQYFAIGFENKSGGFELRNEHFKGSSSPKDVTIIDNQNSKSISVFEGFFSFLSYQTLHQNADCQLTNVLVLNSLSFFENSRQLMEPHHKINLYLDRDTAGLKNTERALHWDEKYIDKSHSYKNHKDLNEYLKSQHPKIKQGLKPGRYF